MANPDGVAVNIHKSLTAQGFTVSLEEVEAAVQHGFEEMDKFKEDLRLKAEDLLMQINLNNEKAIVLAGRPYHLIQKSITELLTSLLKKDSMC